MKIILCSIAFILVLAASLWAETKPVIDFQERARGNLSSEHSEREGKAGYPLAGGASPVEGATRDPVIDVFPPTGYDRATAYLNLAMFWAGIIGLVILLRLKLRELERVQHMEREEAEKAAPLLE